MIAEPASGYLLVLAGLATVYGETGDVLDTGAPVGLMGGDTGIGAANSGQPEEGGGAARAETLYIELRQGEAPVDPAPWFTETRED
jgi:septal ring factor EnvC (AmiA/AmiB activator)